MKTAQGITAIHKGHATDERAVGEEGNVHGREGKQGIHDIGSCRSDSQQAISNV